MAERPLLATYRLQLRKEFGLAAARAIVPYLRRLGVSHAYSSPILAARPGSAHGYDVVDPTRVNPELGSDEDRRALVETLHRSDMGLVLDIVPNHMGIGPANPYWMDVLTYGRQSRYAAWFDIDWEAGGGKVVLPVLGEELDALIDQDQLSLARDQGALRLVYGDHKLPLDPATAHEIPTRDVEAWGRGPEGRARLRALVAQQHYALLFWKHGAKDVNYRRFFDVNDLAGVRQEEPAVFEATHQLILRWVAEGGIDALRIDHIDGLLDPFGYLERLRAEVRERRPRSAESPLPIVVEKILSSGERLRSDWPVQGTTGYEFLNDLEALFIHAEGALALEQAYRELLPARERDDGFAERALQGKRAMLEAALHPDVMRLTRRLTALARRLARAPRPKSGELRAGLVELIACLPVYRTYIDGRRAAPAPPDADVLERAMELARARDEAPTVALELLGALLMHGANGTDERDRDERLHFIQRLQQASGPATAKGVEDTALYQWVPLVSRNEVGGDPGRDLRDAVRRLHDANAERLERWPRQLLCTNTHDTKRSADVRARLDVLSEMPAAWTERVTRWRRLNAMHRTKVKGRYAPDVNTEYLLYQTLVGVWPMAAEQSGADQAERDSRAGVRERVEQYMLKAVKEAKTETSWLEPSKAFEEALGAFIEALLDPERGGDFIADMSEFVGLVARPGLWNAVSRTLVHLTSPGTPDIYQGDELWNFALVDPDNRRPVDYRERARLLEELERAAGGAKDAAARLALARALVGAPRDGKIKLWVTRQALHARRDHPALFREGRYAALGAAGERGESVFAFARHHDAEAAVVVVPRMPLTLLGAEARGAPVGDAVWADTRLPLGDGLRATIFRNALTGAQVRAEGIGTHATLRVAEVLADFPVALLLAD